MQATQRIGQTLASQYQIERLLGEGGMGVVYEATRIGSSERVALKLMLHDVARSPERVERFKREAHAASLAQGEHVVRILDFGSLPTGEPYIVMDLLEGEDLAQWLAREGKLQLAEAVEMLAQACDAMSSAHRAGIIHRDLKPANLFVTRGASGVAQLKVLDFGLSKLVEGSELGGAPMTQTSTILGSPLYMSPEQLRSSRDVDARTDLWSLGVIGFELLTGAPPFAFDNVAELCTAVLMRAAPTVRSVCPDVPESVSAIVARCLEKDPDRRFASAEELGQALRASAPTGRIEVRRACAATAEVRRATPAQDPRVGARTEIEDEPPPTRVRVVPAPSSLPPVAPRPSWGAGETQLESDVPAAAVLPFKPVASARSAAVISQARPRRRGLALWAALGLLALAAVAVALLVRGFWRHLT